MEAGNGRSAVRRGVVCQNLNTVELEGWVTEMGREKASKRRGQQEEWGQNVVGCEAHPDSTTLPDGWVASGSTGGRARDLYRK
jgi:hypothetical protein